MSMSKRLTKGVAAHLTNGSTSTTTSGSDPGSAFDPAASSLPALPNTTTTSPNASSLSSPPPSILSDNQPLPRLIVWDLDYTLWPFWVDTHVVSPIKSSGGPAQHAVALDKTGDSFAFYPDVPQMLYALSRAGVRQAVASRSHAPDLARDMLKILHVSPWSPASGGPVSSGGFTISSKEKPRRALDFFDGGLEIYPSSKVRHFEQIQRKTGVAYSDMLFFDDESRNREVEQVYGVPFCLVRDGMTWQELEKGIKEWRRRRWNGGRGGAAGAEDED